MSALSNRPTRPPVRWSTHWQHILMVLAVVVGGSLFGLSFALWPLRPVERVLGGAIMVGVLAVLVWVGAYLARPVAQESKRPGTRR